MKPYRSVKWSQLPDICWKAYRIQNIFISQAQIMKNKQRLLYVTTKHVEEVQGELINQMVKMTGEGKLYKEKTLDARIKLNRRRAFNQYLNANDNITLYTNTWPLVDGFTGKINYYQSIIELEKSFRPYMRFSQFDRGISYIQQRIRDYQQMIEQKVFERKNIDPKDEEQCRQYVENQQPTSTYGRLITLKTENDEIEELEPIESQRIDILENHMNVIKDYIDLSEGKYEEFELLNVRLFLSPSLQQILIAWKSLTPENNILLVKLSQIHPKNIEVDPLFLSRYRSELILKQLKFNGFALYFVPLNQYELEDLFELLQKEEIKRIELAKKLEDHTNHYFPNIISLKSYQEIIQKLDSLEQFPIEIHSLQQDYIQCYFLVVMRACHLVIIFQSQIYDELMIYSFPASKFECYYIQQLMLLKQTNQLIKFLKKPLVQFSEKLTIRHEQKVIVSNLLDLPLQKCLQDYFGLKLQRWFRCKSFEKYVSMLMGSTQKMHLLNSMIDYQNDTYYRVVYNLHLDYQQLRITVSQLITPQATQIELKKNRAPKKLKKTYSVNLSSLKPLFGKYFLNSLQIAVHLDSQLFEEISKLPKRRSVEFYRRKFHKFLDIIHSKIIITPQLELSYLNLGIPLQKARKLIKKGLILSAASDRKNLNIIRAIVHLQNLVRAKTLKQWYLQKQQRLREIEQKNKGKGQLVKRAFVKLSKITQIESKSIYIANIYSLPINQSSHQKEQILIELVPYITVNKKNENAKLKGTLIIDRSKMFTPGSQSFFGLLLDSVRLENGMLRIMTQDKDFTPYESETFSQNSSINYDAFDEKIESKLVYNLEDENSLYNVLYTGKRPLQIRPQQRDNYVEIGVNLKKMHKLYPELNLQDKMIMKSISEQLVQGIRVKDGLEIDARRIKPTLFKVIEKNIPNIQQGNNYVQQKIKNKEPILKGTKFYNGVKFLIVINYLEMPVKRIIERPKDQIFQEFEIFYEISANQMQNFQKEPIIWRITPEEATTVCGSQSHKDVATYFMNRLTVIEEKFLFSLERKSDYLHFQPQPQVIFFFEIALRPLQRMVRNRQPMMNRRAYRQELLQWKDENGGFLPSVYIYSTSRLRSVNCEFIVLCGEDKTKKLVVIAWRISNFNRYQVDILKQKIQIKQLYRKQFINFLMDQKKKLALINILLQRFIQFHEASETLSIEIPKEVNLEVEVDDMLYNLEQVQEMQNKLDSISEV